MMTLTRIHVVHFGQIERAGEIKPKFKLTTSQLWQKITEQLR